MYFPRICLSLYLIYFLIGTLCILEPVYIVRFRQSEEEDAQGIPGTPNVFHENQGLFLWSWESCTSRRGVEADRDASTAPSLISILHWQRVSFVRPTDVLSLFINFSYV